MLTQHTFHFIGVGASKHAFIRDGVKAYSRQIKKFGTVNWHFCREVKSTGDTGRLLEQEASAISRLLKQIPSHYLIVLQAGTKGPDSEQLAKTLGRWMEHKKNLVFLTGGAFGVHPSILNSADTVLSLGPLTMNHQLVRLVLLEQIFRSLSIHFGMDYHH